MVSIPHEARNNQNSEESQAKFDYEMYKAALNYLQTPIQTAWVFCLGMPYIDKHTNKQKFPLIPTRASMASKNGKAVWVHINPVNEETAINKMGEPKKAAVSEMAEIRNISLEFECPEDPDKSHRVARDFVDRLIQAGFVDPSQPIEDSGAGNHIVIPIQAIEMEDGTQEQWNGAVARVVDKHFKKLFAEACQAQNVTPDSNHMCLGSFNIDRVLSVPGTFRPTNPAKNDCEALKSGYFRRWLAPYVEGKYPERIESEKVRELILSEFVAGPEKAKTRSNGHTKNTEGAFGDYQEYIRWLEDYNQKKQTGDRSADFNALVWGCYAKYGEDITRILTEEIDRITGQKYGERADEELERSLQKAMEQVTRNANQAKASAMPPNNNITDEQLCFFTADDAGNADAMFALFGENFLWCGAMGWLYWCGTHWCVDVDDSIVRKKAVETLRKRRHAAVNQENENVIKCTKGDIGRIRGCLEVFKSLVTIGINEFDNDPDYLNCTNGAVDLRTGILQPHSREQRFTFCSPVAYKVASHPLWDDFLNDVVGGGQEMIDYLQMASGYSLTGHTSEECLFYPFGPTRSGKGTFSSVFLSIIPTPLGTSVDFNTFTSSRKDNTNNFDLARLKPARIIFASESNRYQALNPSKVKQLTGNDEITASFKGKDLFTYTPQFKIWMLSNHQVNGDPEDDALWGRVKVIPFPNSYLGKEDKSKKRKMKSPAVLEAVLYWAVQGAVKWYALGDAGLHTPQVVQEATNKHRSDLDYIQQWIDEEGEFDGTTWTSAKDVHDSYATWCKANNVTAQRPRDFGLSLKKKGCLVGKDYPQTRRTINGVQLTGIIGVKLSAKSKSEDEYNFSEDF